MRLPTDSTTPTTNLEVQPGVWLDSRRAVWLADERLLVIADLHWGYAAAHHARGNLLPCWGDEDIASRLESLIADYSPAEMIWVGDIVHAAEGAAAAERFLSRPPVATTVLAGNHDRRWNRLLPRSHQRGRYYFHHGDITTPAPSGLIEVLGHHHPAVTWWDGAGSNLKLPALIAGPSRLILPAFSPWAAGTDCRPLLTARCTAWAISPKRIFAVEHNRNAAAV